MTHNKRISKPPRHSHKPVGYYPMSHSIADAYMDRHPVAREPLLIYDMIGILLILVVAALLCN